MFSQVTRLAFLAVLISPSHASGQLLQWLVRDVGGVHVMDLSTPQPTVGPIVPGLGTSGAEDVNMMTDQNGNVLFCTAVNDLDEVKVYDATLSQMPNGTGLFGHNSSLQSAISPIPCHTEKYYLIHLETGPVGALYYSVVDMTLNGGSGDVAQANTLIGTGFTEGLAVSRQLPNGCRWLFSSLRSGNSYQLVRCLISHTGIGPPAILATVPTSLPANAWNEIELGPDNTRIAMSTGTTTGSDPDITVWDLDLTTGTVTNAIALQVSTDPIIGVQFSPMGNYIYYVGNGTTDDMDFGRVELGTWVAQLIDPMMGKYLTMVELAGNGRIYVGLNYNYDHLAEVASPDEPLLPNIGYAHNAVLVPGSGCRPALPNAIEGEPPGTTITPAYIAFSAYSVGPCDTYQFVDSTCLTTWWEWNFGDGTSSNDPSPVHTFPSGTFDITLRVVACGDTLELISPAFIQSNTAPSDAIMILPDTLCTGQTVAFGNVSNAANTFLWDLGDGTLSTDSFPVHTYTSSGTYTVSLIVTNSCSSDTAVGEVHVIEGGTASFTTSGTCTTTIAFTNTSTGSTNGIWDLGDGATSSDWSPVHSYPGPGSYVVQLIVGPGTICADSTSQTIDIDTRPSAVFTDSLGCQQDLFLYDGSSGAVSWLWSFGDGGTSLLPSPQHLYDTAGIYPVTLVVSSALGCSDTTSLVVEVPPGVVSAFRAEMETCSGAWTFVNLSTNAFEYEWSLGDGTMTEPFSPIHVYASPGSYTVELISLNGLGCADTTAHIVHVPETTPEAQLFVPNCFTPNDDGINDRFVLGGSADCLTARLSIFNRWGAILLDGSAQLSWDGTFNGQKVPDGVYMYLVESEDLVYRGHVTLLR
ncbi:MAG: PKD domain-containing protein [Flavobacteriales bacterium]|nr:PKD domain-containing protein [Flavobacteriales bacterium]